MASSQITSCALVLLALCSAVQGAIDRHALVARFNPVRTASSTNTPMQVGNGHFAFGADVTGLQTFLPWATMSDWGWKNDSFPPGMSAADLASYRGVVWDGVQYEFGGPEPTQQWLISNPNRVNLGRVGLLFVDGDGGAANVTEEALGGRRQVLDLWTGTITSTFRWEGEEVTVRTVAAQSSSALSLTISSSLLLHGRLGIFLDFPWNDGSQKFEAPFVGVWNATSSHTTSLKTGSGLGRNVHAQVAHTMVENTFFTSISGDDFTIARVSQAAHRYEIKPRSPQGTFSIAIAYSSAHNVASSTPTQIQAESTEAWEDFWSNHGFVDVLTGSTDARAEELQRRIILSQYLLRVNEAGDYPPQESGLVDNGWYGKFHMEMFFWHSAHWALWNNWDLLERASSVYARFLPTAIERAQVQQGYPIATLEKWREVVHATADWMSVFAHKNTSTGFFDLGPPMYVVSEDTNPNVTRNPAFELAYWRFGLDHASTWLTRLGEDVPALWTEVKENLAPLPIENGLYAVYEGIPNDFWDTPTYTNDHPALVGLYGWLPRTANVSTDMAKATAEKVWTSWNISNCWGWDFPMLAMSAARNGETEKAIEWLLHPLFEFDDIGMPVGGVRVPTPYFPGSGALLYAVAMMAEGWDGSEGNAPGFPTRGWAVRTERMSKAI
ncbi:hypothetical protein BN946_scf184392.g5 [Trametes cinnabarina]|uniref:Uncharacterized protein n=1 Tax=Pycnoporus cinnabarinus TaxID=5643 RepID=A0A060SQA8_PYCCI|nr:hypothetical protein BN946_scf184392.g5 [Trametes cinnabarina]